MLNCTNGINEIGYSEYWYITNSKIYHISSVLFSYNLYVKLSMSKEKKSMQ